MLFHLFCHRHLHHFAASAAVVQLLLSLAELCRPDFDSLVSSGLWPCLNVVDDSVAG